MSFLKQKRKDTFLFVRAVAQANVHEISEKGVPLMDFRIVGKEHGEIVLPGVMVPYHSHYVNKLKEGSLQAADLDTAKLAGVAFVE